MRYVLLALRWWRFLWHALALGGLLFLFGCATVGYKDHFKRGGALLNRDQYTEAEKEFREAIRQTPDSESRQNLAWVYYWLGWSVEKQKRYDDAEQAYREAIRLDPFWAKAHNNLGVVLGLQEKYPEAEKEFREAVRLKPDFAEAHFGLGFAIQEQEEYQQLGEPEYREAIRLKPNYPEAHYRLGCLLQVERKYDEAVQEYREAIRLKPDYLWAIEELAKTLDGSPLMRRKEARPLWERALKLEKRPQAIADIKTRLGEPD
jgi:tetratricopeptide (TPR) repeat protein